EITEKIGYIVKHKNSRMIADAVNALLVNPVMMKKMQEFAYRRVKERQWSHIAKKYLQTFRQVARHYD
ncbi:MAG: hypothetical protein V3T40_05910, partial [Nitrososphaerales archaeon]